MTRTFLIVFVCLLCIAGGAAIVLNYDTLASFLPPSQENNSSGSGDDPTYVPTDTSTPGVTMTTTPASTQVPDPDSPQIGTSAPTETSTPTVTQTVTPTVTQTVTPTVTQTVTPTVTQTSSSGTSPTPVVTATPLPWVEAISGTWIGQKNDFLVSYDLKLVCNEDGTAQLSGTISGAGISKTINADLIWEYVSGTHYLGKNGDDSLDIYVDGNTMDMTVNPKKLGVADYDINYPISLQRSSL
ncbi:MAG: hypothetical protein WCS17_11920 [Prevotella sp.]